MDGDMFDWNMMGTKEVIFIDTRSRGYYLISHIDGAINIESAQRIGYIAEENKDKIIALYCHTGLSATQMAQELAQKGHKNVRAIQENFFHLPKYGLKIIGEGALKP